MDRYAREIVRGLDGLLASGEAVLVVPEGACVREPMPLRNIPLVRYGGHSGHVWEQVDLPRYLKANGLLGLNLCNTAPLLRPGVVCVHDMAIRANPKFFGRRFVLWYRIMYRFIMRGSERVITVSEFSRREIERYYPIARGKVEVAPNAWQHIMGVDADCGVLERNDLTGGDFYFAMSSLAPNKNLRWIVGTALLNPGERFVVAGGLNAKVFGDHEIPDAGNVVYAGYVTDGEAKALMEGCKAFLYPTFYEGFGIPPMEALACGAAAVVSDTEVMHEVYGDAVSYVDPHSAGALPPDGARESDRLSVEAVLSRFDWRESAMRVLSVLDGCAGREGGRRIAGRGRPGDGGPLS